MKKLPMLSADLRQLVKRLGDEGAQLFATDVITEMGKRVPVDTGRMSKAGMAFVGNKLVAQTGDQIQIPPRMWKRKNTISFIFRTFIARSAISCPNLKLRVNLYVSKSAFSSEFTANLQP